MRNYSLLVNLDVYYRQAAVALELGLELALLFACMNFKKVNSPPIGVVDSCST